MTTITRYSGKYKTFSWLDMPTIHDLNDTFPEWHGQNQKALICACMWFCSATNDKTGLYESLIDIYAQRFPRLPGCVKDYLDVICNQYNHKRRDAAGHIKRHYRPIDPYTERLARICCTVLLAHYYKHYYQGRGINDSEYRALLKITDPKLKKERKYLKSIKLYISVKE